MRSVPRRPRAPRVVLSTTFVLFASIARAAAVHAAPAQDGAGASDVAVTATHATPATAAIVATADLDGDGVPDVVTVDRNANTVIVMLRRADGSFAAQQPVRSVANARRVVVQDLNGDGRPDVVVLGDSVAVHVNAGDALGEAMTVAANGAADVTVGDVDGDGVPDLTLAAAGARTAPRVLHGNGDGSFGDVLDAPQVSGLPAGIAMSASPNPAPGRIAIKFTLAKSSRATLVIHDLTGRVVATPFDRDCTAGPFTVDWDASAADGSHVPPGVYFAELVTPSARSSQRMVVVR